MLKSVTDLMPNIKPYYEVLLFKGYKLIEHYPFSASGLIGSSLGDILDLLHLAFPDDCNYVFYRCNDHNTTVKEYGSYTCIINTKYLLKDAKNPSLGN